MPVGGFSQLDSQPLVRYGHIDIVFEFFEIWDLANRFFKLVLDFVHVVFGDDEIFADALHVAAGFFRGTSRIAKISAHRLLNFLLELSSQRTMKSAIMAVTKSAYATFHAPP